MKCIIVVHYWENNIFVNIINVVCMKIARDKFYCIFAIGIIWIRANNDWKLIGISFYAVFYLRRVGFSAQKLKILSPKCPMFFRLQDNC